MPRKNPLAVSYSSAQDWRTCEQRYWYSHVQKIRPKIRHAALELGTLIHTYLDEFYRAGLSANNLRITTVGIQMAHERGLRKVSKQGESIKLLAQTALDLGVEDEARALQAIPQTATDILIAYYRVRGQKDLRQHRVVLVEPEITLPIKKGIVLPGRIDLVTKNKHGFWLWEHKSTGSIPRPDSRFRDLQTLIYAVALEELQGIKITGIIWNYIRTVPPHPPALLKRGGLSVAKGQTTTVDLFLAACKEHKQSVKAYQPYLRHLEAWERDTMFVRYTLPVSASENILMRDYVHTVEDIEAVRADENYVAIRNIDAHCNWCPYVKLCQALILGGDTDVLMRKYFTDDTKQKGGESISNGQDEIEALLEA